MDKSGTNCFSGYTKAATKSLIYGPEMRQDLSSAVVEAVMKC